ncbi:hypothetical protein AB0L41_05575 [Amycolatopsis mediterranei]|uniref:hypothetical protein n=1 Tax=Amycolatopsis mediterranei TaxID=33910 RepID=UPI003412CAC3
MYLLAGGRTLAWIAFVLLVPVALLGFTMLARWLPGRRARDEAAPEQHFPVVVVGGARGVRRRHRGPRAAGGPRRRQLTCPPGAESGTIRP